MKQELFFFFFLMNQAKTHCGSHGLITTTVTGRTVEHQKLKIKKRSFNFQPSTSPVINLIFNSSSIWIFSLSSLFLSLSSAFFFQFHQRKFTFHHFSLSFISLRQLIITVGVKLSISAPTIVPVSTLRR